VPSPSLPLSTDQLDDLQAFLKDWLRHTGRTQADLRRVLRTSSIRMPVLIEELHRIHNQQGLAALADRLCGIENLWHNEDSGIDEGSGGSELLAESLGQLDLLLEQIRLETGNDS
jgi:hypothetical protein